MNLNEASLHPINKKAHELHEQIFIIIPKEASFGLIFSGYVDGDGSFFIFARQLSLGVV